MILDYVPLLQLQRDLHRIPRGMERFREYLRFMINPEGDDLTLAPLAMMNPMGKEHVAALLDELLAMDADNYAKRAMCDVQAHVKAIEGVYKVATVVVDDLMGGWTNRYAYEFSLRFGSPPKKAKELWIPIVLWSSEPASERTIRESVQTAIYRTAYIAQHGRAKTLRAMLQQEGTVLAMAGCTTPSLDADDIEYTREVLRPYLDADDMRTAIECLWGDAAAKTLGFSPHGLSANAGLALALHDARQRQPFTMVH